MGAITIPYRIGMAGIIKTSCFLSVGDVLFALCKGFRVYRRAKI